MAMPTINLGGEGKRMWWLVGILSYAAGAAAFYAALVAKAQPEPAEAGEMPRLCVAASRKAA